MSNFFTRLSERHAVAPTIKPRAVSRFEVGAQGMPAITENESTANTAVVPRRVADARPEVRAPGRDFSRDDTAAVPQREPAPVIRVAPSVERQPVVAEAFRDARDTTVDPMSARAASEPLQRRKVAASTDIAPMETSRRGDAAADSARELLRRNPPVVPRSVVQPLSVAVAPSVIAARGDDSPREPDVIRVHIGRVEVRAIMPPARPLPRTSTPSNYARPMSLDQYLGWKERGRA